MPIPTDAELEKALCDLKTDATVYRTPAILARIARTLLPALIAEVRKLREALDAALELLGTGACVVNTCKGCKVERNEAIAILRAARKGQDATQS